MDFLPNHKKKDLLLKFANISPDSIKTKRNPSGFAKG